MNQTILEHIFPSGHRLQLVKGDLTIEKVDAIVNAANSYLKHGGGVAGAIVSKGGGQIQVESDQWIRENGPVSHEKPAYTHGGNLPCKYVIHAVGPIWGEGDEDAKFSEAVKGSLILANQLGIISIAFPAISTGIFGFPKDRAAKIMINTISEYFFSQPESEIKLVRITLYDLPTLEIFKKTWFDIDFS